MGDAVWNVYWHTKTGPVSLVICILHLPLGPQTVFLYILASLLVMQARETASLGPNEEMRGEGEEGDEGGASWEEIKKMMA